MRDKINDMAATFTDKILPGYRGQHPVRAALIDAVILSTPTCWLLALTLWLWEVAR